MASRFDLSYTLRRRWATAAVTMTSIAPLLGCGPGLPGDDEFRVTRVEFDGDSSLTLTFTQPIANVDAIDPNDFRISLARSFRSSYQNPGTGVTEVSELTFYEDIGWLTEYYDYDPPRFSFESATLGDVPHKLVLKGIDNVLAPACALVEYYANYYYQPNEYNYTFSSDIALFVHYAGREIPLESQAGEILANIGADWVINDPDYLERDAYGFTQLEVQLRIPCE